MGVRSWQTLLTSIVLVRYKHDLVFIELNDQVVLGCQDDDLVGFLSFRQIAMVQNIEFFLHPFGGLRDFTNLE